MPEGSKTSVRQVLEAIGRKPGGMTDEKDAVGLLSLHLGLVQAANEFDELAELVKIRDGAREALRTTFNVRTESALARSHADVLLNALAPLERLIENREMQARSERKGPPPVKPKVEPPPSDKPKVEAVAPPEDDDPSLAPAQKGIRVAKKGGKLRDQLKDPTFFKEVSDWMAKADPKDPKQKQDMLAVLLDMDPAMEGERQKAFEQTFATKVHKSDKRKYEPVMLRSGKQAMQNGKPAFREVLEENVKLDPKSVSAMAEIMGQLPTEHMPGGWIFEAHTQDNGTTGSFNDETDMANLRFSLLDLHNGLQQEYTNVGDGDPLQGAKAFDVMVRHECGHKAAAVAKSDRLTSQPIGGEWIHHDTTDNVLTAINAEFKDLVTKIQAGKDTPAEPAIRKAVANPDNGFDAFTIAEALKVPEDRVPADHIVFQVLQQGYGARYMCGTSPVSVAGRMYVVGGPGVGSWFSFAKSSWEKRVSFYQYAAPNEWFAEFYATANNGDEKVRKAAKQRYPDAWAWLQTNNCIVFADPD